MCECADNVHHAKYSNKCKTNVAHLQLHPTTIYAFYNHLEMYFAAIQGLWFPFVLLMRGWQHGSTGEIKTFCFFAADALRTKSTSGIIIFIAIWNEVYWLAS